MKTAEEWRKECGIGHEHGQMRTFVRAIQADALRWAAEQAGLSAKCGARVISAEADAIERGDQQKGATSERGPEEDC